MVNKMKKFENVYQDAALMRRVLLGEADEAEQQELEKRLAECPDLQKVYEQLQNGETDVESCL
jgi:transmembrane sensor